MKPSGKIKKVAVLAATALTLGMVVASPAAAATGGGCITTNTSPQATIRACDNATNLGYNINSDAYISNDPGCSSVFIGLVDTSNSYVTGGNWVNCSGHVIGPTHYGYGNKLRTAVTMYFINGAPVTAYGPWLSN